MLKVSVGKNAQGEELKWQELSGEELVAMAATEALFGGDQTFVLEGALYSERGEEFLDLLEVFAESPHTFIFVEQKLLKAEADALKKAGATIEIEKAVKKDYVFDNFGVAGALGGKEGRGRGGPAMLESPRNERRKAVPRAGEAVPRLPPRRRGFRVIT